MAVSNCAPGRSIDATVRSCRAKKEAIGKLSSKRTTEGGPVWWAGLSLIKVEMFGVFEAGALLPLDDGST